MGIPEYLPVLEGWAHLWKTYIPGEIKPITPGDTFHLLEEKESGWGWHVIVISRSNPFWTLNMAVDDFTMRNNVLTASPFFSFTHDFTVPNDHIWTPPVAYAAGIYVLAYTPAAYRPYKKYIDINIQAPTRNLITGAPIVAPLVVDGALIVRIKIEDVEAFKRSVRKLLTPL